EDADARAGARKQGTSGLEQGRAAGAEFHGRPYVRRAALSARRSRAAHRLDAVLPDMGAGGALSGNPRGSRGGTQRAQPVQRCASDAAQDRGGEMAEDESGRGVLSGELGWM